MYIYVKNIIRAMWVLSIWRSLRCIMRIIIIIQYVHSIFSDKQAHTVNYYGEDQYCYNIIIIIGQVSQIK